MDDQHAPDSMASLYLRLGGEDAFHAVVEDFYSRVLRDPALSRFFAGMDMTRLKAHQQAYLAEALGGPVAYAGRDMRSAHAHLLLTREHFFAVTDHLVAALSAAGAEESVIGEVVDRLEPLIRLIVSA